MAKRRNLARLARSDSEAERGRAASHPALPDNVQQRLSRDKSEWVREQLARNPSLKDAIRKQMARRETSLTVAKVLVSEAVPNLRTAVWRAAMESETAEGLRSWGGRHKLCPTPKKRRFRTEEEAVAADNGSRYGVPFFHYACLCGVWHNTKVPSAQGLM